MDALYAHAQGFDDLGLDARPQWVGKGPPPTKKKSIACSRQLSKATNKINKH